MEIRSVLAEAPQVEMTVYVSTETLYNLVRIGAIISALKNNILLSNPRTSLFVTSPTLRRYFFTESCSIVVKLKQHVLFDPRGRGGL